jgi:hypothetical protein
MESCYQRADDTASGQMASRGMGMPNSIKAFFALSVTIAAWFLFLAAQSAFFSTPEYLARIAQLPSNLQDLVRNADRWADAFLATRGAGLLLLACLITFGHHSWSRWALVILIVLGYVAPALPTLLSEGLPFERRWAIFTSTWWLHPIALAWLGIWALMITLVFSPNARPWFRKQVPERG